MTAATHRQRRRRPALDRRWFLKSAALGGVAFVPYFSSAPARAVSKNDRPTFAAIGLGGQGTGIAKGATEFADLVACCDVDRRRAENFAQGKKIAVYDDFRRLLDRKDVEAVTIATPDHWHAAIAIRALRAGKDVYCEKPLGLTVDEGRRVRDAVRATKRVFQVGTQQRSTYLFLKALALVKKGWLGKVDRATCLLGSGPRGGPFAEEDPPAGLNWDFWLGQAPAVSYARQRCHYQFRWWLEYSGGKLTDWGAHHIDIAQWALGHERSGPVSIEGHGDLPTGRNCYNTAVTFAVRLTFGDDAVIDVRNGPVRGPWFDPTPLPTSLDCPDPRQSLDNGIWLHGPRGTIFVNRKKLTGRPIDELSAADDAWIEEAIREIYGGRPVVNHIANFFDCVGDRRQPIGDAATTHRTASSCHLCNIALRLGRRLEWDPAAEDFIGDPAASALIARPQRPGYTLDEMIG